MVKWLCWDLSVQSYYLLMIFLASMVSYVSDAHYKLRTPAMQSDLNGKTLEIPQSDVEFYPVELYLVLFQEIVLIIFFILTQIALILFIFRNFALRGYPEFYIKYFASAVYLIGFCKFIVVIMAIYYSNEAPSWITTMIVALVQFLELIPLRIWSVRGAEAVIKHNMGIPSDSGVTMEIVN